MADTLPVQYVKFNTKRCFGIELEVIKSKTLEELVSVVRGYDPKRQCVGTNHYTQDAGNDYWHVKFDRSCGTRSNEGGWEVSSYKASGAADLVKLSAMGDTLKKNGAQVNENCGYHIHVEIDDFNTTQAASLMAYWMKLERMVQEILPKNRRNNIYCRMLSEHKPVTAVQAKTVETFWPKVRPLNSETAERRVALNMCNYVHGSAAKKTAELRLPEGTLDSKDIKNWARMFIHFVNTCRTSPFPGNVVPYPDLKSAMIGLGLHNEDPFFILSKGLYETKTWFLERALKYSASKVTHAEADALLNLLIPPSPEDKVEPTEAQKKEAADKKKKRKLSADKRPYRSRVSSSEFWQPYQND